MHIWKITLFFNFQGSWRINGRHFPECKNWGSFSLWRMCWSCIQGSLWPHRGSSSGKRLKAVKQLSFYFLSSSCSGFVNLKFASLWSSKWWWCIARCVLCRATETAQTAGGAECNYVYFLRTGNDIYPLLRIKQSCSIWNSCLQLKLITIVS